VKSSIDSVGWPSSLGIVKSAGRRLTVLALFVVVALTTTGRAWSALVPTAGGAEACCQGGCQSAPVSAQPCDGPCNSLSPLACGNQPVSVTTLDAVDATPPMFAIASSIPDLLPSPPNFPVLAVAPQSLTPRLIQHAILRL